ncbi:MAG: hydantoinase/oxoprolinase family protein [Gammaproteobacteria bacterium]|nr:hydantoinase/oxoprolinase family protein [Gammaproteobacteria bacterium]
MHILGVDTGGTFTDLVYFNGQSVLTHKELSTPHAPEHAILRGIATLGIDIEALQVVHGTTVATNALLEGKGARTVFVTNHGFSDLLRIGRQTRDELYNLTPREKRTLFDPQLSLETGGRVGADGKTVQPLPAEEIEALVSRIEQLDARAVAICLLFSFVDNRFEKAIRERLAGRYFVSVSSEVLAEYREYERGLATWVNSYLGPVMQGYLSRLGEKLPDSRISVMQSDGLTLGTDTAERNAVRLLLSGPAGGLWGSFHAGAGVGHRRLLTFDMGGTSTDVSIIDGEFGLTGEGRIAGLPIAVPMLDIHTIGAGGGSVAWVDEGGLLQVGPDSAGASPGPACYGRGGSQATVTDAHVVLGRLPSSCKLAGNLALDADAARTAVSDLARRLGLDTQTCAQGIVRIANEQMAQALRVMSVHRGHDPKHFTLVSFGGAGGLHVCDLAGALRIRQALVPAHTGVLSAVGLLAAPSGKEVSLSCIRLLDRCQEDEVSGIFGQLECRITDDLGAEAISEFRFKREIDLRYQGQSATLRLPWLGRDAAARAFHERHRERFGYALDMPVELVNVRLTAHGTDALDMPAPQIARREPGRPFDQAALVELETQVPVFTRPDIGQGQALTGPAIIVEAQATLYLAPGWTAVQQVSGSLLLERTDAC